MPITIVPGPINKVVVSTVGKQGPPGSTGGVAIVQDYAPPVGANGQMWFNNVTRELFISNGTTWLSDEVNGGSY